MFIVDLCNMILIIQQFLVINKLIAGCIQVKVWSGQLGESVSEAGGEDDGQVTALAFHPEGHTAAAGYHSGMLRIYHIESGNKAKKTISVIKS